MCPSPALISLVSASSMQELVGGRGPFPRKGDPVDGCVVYCDSLDRSTSINEVDLVRSRVVVVSSSRGRVVVDVVHDEWVGVRWIEPGRETGPKTWDGGGGTISVVCDEAGDPTDVVKRVRGLGVVGAELLTIGRCI